MAIKNTYLGNTSITQVFSATAQTAITTAIFCNVTTNTNATINVYAVPSGSAALPQTQIMKEVPLSSGDTFVLDTERLILETNDSIWAQASNANCITVTVSTLVTG